MADSKYGPLFTLNDVQLILDAADKRAKGQKRKTAEQLVEQLREDGADFRFPPDEPLMLLRGQSCPVAILQGYASTVEALGSPPEHVRLANENVVAFREFQAEHPPKVPD